MKKLVSFFVLLCVSAHAFAWGGFGGCYVGFSAKTEVVSNSANQSGAVNKVCLSPYNWVGRIKTNGGAVSSESIAIARNIISALSTTTYVGKITAFYPMLDNLTAARCPLLYSGTANSGIAANTNFVSGDFSATNGLQGDGINKVLNTRIHPSEAGSSSNGGLDYWENNVDFTAATEVMGCYNAGSTSRFVIDRRSTRKFFSWGNAGNLAGPLTASTNGHYEGDRSSATLRELDFNGSSIGTNTTSDSAAGAGDEEILLLGCNEGGTTVFAKTRCAEAAILDGTFTSTEKTDWHNLLLNYLFTPLGRPSS